MPGLFEPFLASNAAFLRSGSRATSGGEDGLSFRFRTSRAARLPLFRASHGFARDHVRLERDAGGKPLHTFPHPALVLGLAAHLCLLAPFALAAEEDGGKNKPAPMPPARPMHLQAAPAPAAVPKTVAVVPVPAAPIAPQQAAPNDDTVSTIYVDHGPMLPPASRSRMHQCGHEWEAMKASGAAADQTWRAFAQACLVR
jgi:hypothetical protein